MPNKSDAPGSKTEMAENTVTVVWPDTGDTKEVPAKNLESELSVGYIVDTPEAKAKRDEETQFSTGGQQLATGAEGLLRGGTLGLSDEAETGLGISTPEDISKRKEYNPTAAALSEGAGLVGSLFIPGLDEAEGVMKGASAVSALPRATEAIGKGAGGLTKKILQGLGAAPEGITTRALSSAADTAAQAEIYNAAQNVDETHLAGGNMQQAAENILASSGSALELGAALGAAIPVAGLGLKLAASKAGQALSKVGAFARDKLPALGEAATNAYAKVASPLSGMSEDAIKEDLSGAFTPEGAAAREKKLTGVTAEERDVMQKEFQGSLQSALDATHDAVKQGFRELRPEETARLTKDVPIGPASEDAYAIGEKMKESIAAMRAEPEIYSPAIVRRLEIAERGFSNKLVNEGVGTTEELFEMMNDLKSKALDPVANLGGNVSVSEREAIKQVRDIRAMVKAHLENPDAYGEAAARQAAFNDAYASWRTLVGDPKKRGVFQKFFLDKEATKGGGQRLVVSPTKINAYLNKVGAARDAAHTQALTDFLESSQRLVSELGQSASNAGVKDFDAEGIKSLLGTVKEQGVNNADRLQYVAKQRALANAPFVSSSPLNIVNKHGSLATAGAIIGGAPGAAIGSAISGAASLLTNPHEAMRALSMLEGLALKTSSKIASGVRSGVRVGAELASSATNRLRPLATEETTEVRNVPKSNMEHRIDYRRALSEQTQSKVDPVTHQQQLENEAPEVTSHAPRVSSLMAANKKKISDFLDSRFPRDPSPMPPLGHGNDWQPSRAEWQDYQQIKKVATRPMTAVEHFKQGQLTADDVQTLSQLWPNILGQMRQAAAESVEKSRKPLTNRQMEQLGTLFGTPVDATQTPDFTAAVQQVWTQQAAAKAQSQGSAPEASTQFSKDFMTASEKIASQ